MIRSLRLLPMRSHGAGGRAVRQHGRRAAPDADRRRAGVRVPARATTFHLAAEHICRATTRGSCGTRTSAASSISSTTAPAALTFVANYQAILGERVPALRSQPGQLHPRADRSRLRPRGVEAGRRLSSRVASPERSPQARRRRLEHDRRARRAPVARAAAPQFDGARRHPRRRARSRSSTTRGRSMAVRSDVQVRPSRRACVFAAAACGVLGVDGTPNRGDQTGVARRRRRPLRRTAAAPSSCSSPAERRIDPYPLRVRHRDVGERGFRLLSR